MLSALCPQRLLSKTSGLGPLPVDLSTAFLDTSSVPHIQDAARSTAVILAGDGIGAQSTSTSHHQGLCEHTLFVDAYFYINIHKSYIEGNHANCQNKAHEQTLL